MTVAVRSLHPSKATMATRNNFLPLSPALAIMYLRRINRSCLSISSRSTRTRYGPPFETRDTTILCAY